jgi:parvulin-like peptidyl-prolyl isomerase
MRLHEPAVEADTGQPASRKVGPLIPRAVLVRAATLVAALALPSATVRAGDSVVAVVDGIEIQKSDVADATLLLSRQSYVEAMRECVQRVLVDREAERLSVAVAPEAIEKALTQELEHEKSALLVQFGGKVSFGEYIAENYRMTEADYREAVRQAIRTKLLLGRVIRFGTLGEERLALRTIVVRDRAKADEIRSKLKDGADFIALARKESVDSSAKDGGRLPPITRGVLQPDIEKSVFEMMPGQVSDLFVVNDHGETTYHLFRLIERQAPVSKPWSEAAAEVEKDLDTKPLDPYEVVEWSRKMETRHHVEIAGPRAAPAASAKPSDAGVKKPESAEKERSQKP